MIMIIILVTIRSRRDDKTNHPSTSLGSPHWPVSLLKTFFLGHVASRGPPARMHEDGDDDGDDDNIENYQDGDDDDVGNDQDGDDDGDVDHVDLDVYYDMTLEYFEVEKKIRTWCCNLCLTYL